MRRPTGHRIGENGVVLRKDGPFGARIDIPAPIGGLVETLHYKPDATPDAIPPLATTIDISTLLLPLSTEFARGFSAISFERMLHVGLDSVALWRPDDTGLEFFSRFVEIEERWGCGVLAIDYPREPRPSNALELPKSFLAPTFATRLIFDNAGRAFESGIAIATIAGDELILVASAFPFLTEIQASFADDIAGLTGVRELAFVPESSISQYRRVRIV